MEKKKIKIGLIPKLIIAIILGILFGSFMPEWFNRVMVTCSSIFSTFLSFIIPLMIVAYVTMGIANLRSGAGKLLLITVILSYFSTLVAGSASYLVSSNLFPSFMSEGALDQIAADRRRLPGGLLLPVHSAAAGHPVRRDPGLCAGPVPVHHAGQGDRRQPLPRHGGLLRHH